MISRVILLIIILLPNYVLAQNLWSKIYNGFTPKSFINFPNEGYLISGNNDGNIHLLRTDIYGNQIEKSICNKPDTFFPTNYTVFQIKNLEDQSLILVGSTTSTFVEPDILIMKTNYSGDTLWTKNYGGNSVEEAYSVDITLDGGYVIAGYTTSFGAGWDDIWLLKTDSNGDSLWTRSYGYEYTDKAYVVKQTNDKGFIIGGITGTPSNQDIWILKTDVYGDTIWSKIYGGHSHEYINSLISTQDGGYLIAGSTWSYSNGQTDMWLIKINSAGDTLWTRTFGGEFGDSAEEVIQLDNGNFVVAGYIGQIEGDLYGSTDACLLTMSNTGEILWSKLYGGIFPDEAISVVQSADGGFIVLGSSYSFDADIWLFKTDQYGNSNIPVSIEPLKNNFIDNPRVNAFPNPFNNTTNINFNMPYSGFLSLIIYDISGKKIKTLLNDYMPGGEYSINWNGKNDNGQNLSSAIYIYELRSSLELISTGKLVFIK